jgi:hypothetical protein
VNDRSGAALKPCALIAVAAWSRTSKLSSAAGAANAEIPATFARPVMPSG